MWDDLSFRFIRWRFFVLPPPICLLLFLLGAVFVSSALVALFFCNLSISLFALATICLTGDTGIIWTLNAFCWSTSSLRFLLSAASTGIILGWFPFITTTGCFLRSALCRLKKSTNVCVSGMYAFTERMVILYPVSSVENEGYRVVRRYLYSSSQQRILDFLICLLDLFYDNWNAMWFVTYF